jgi:hypothetical protein
VTAADRVVRVGRSIFGSPAPWCVAVHLAITRDALWVGRDSGVYAGVADNLVRGRGATVPFETQMYPTDVVRHLELLPKIPSVLFPPGYPSLLASLMAFGIDRSLAARTVNVVALLVAVSGVRTLVRVLAPSAGWTAWVAAAMVGLSPSVLAMSTQYMSDLVFLALFVWCVVTVIRLIDRERATWGAEGVFGILSVAAVATRNVGVCLVAAGFVVTLLGGRGIRRAAIVAGPGLATAMVWHGFVRSAGEERVLSVHANIDEVLREGLTTIGDWFMPSGSPAALRAGAIVGALCVALLGVRAIARAGVVGWFVVPTVGAAYLAIVVASRFFVGDEIPLSARMLTPLLVLVVSVAAAGLAVSTLPSRSRWVTAVVIAVAVVAPVRNDGAWAIVNRRSTAEALSDSIAPDPVPTILRLAARAPADVVIVSNRPERMWFDLERSSLALPRRRDSNRGGPNEQFEPELEAIATVMRDRPMLVVVVRDRELADTIAAVLGDAVCDDQRTIGGVLLYGAPGCGGNPLPILP